MNRNKLFIEIGLIDDELIMEAEAIKKAKSFHVIWKRVGLAACLTATVFTSVVLLRLTGENEILPGRNQKKIQEPGNSITAPGINENSLIFNKATGLADSNIYIPGHFWEELTAEEIQAVLPGLSDSEATATAHFQGDGTLFNIDVHTKIKSGTDVYIQLAPGEPILDYSFNSTPVESKISGVPVLAGYCENICFANFKLDDVGYYLEFTADAEGTTSIDNAKEMFTELIFNLITGGAADFSVLNPVIPELKDDKLSIEEAYADNDFGSYLPQDLPNGFAFEASVRFISQEKDYLSALWCKGLNDFKWQVSNFSESDELRITSVADAKNYDLALYPIPRADSVPEGLREIVDNPIFHIDDLTLEAVMARAYTVNDKGDDDGYRMRFSVLYNEDILVEVNVKGVDPQYLFNQLIDIKHW